MDHSVAQGTETTQFEKANRNVADQQMPPADLTKNMVQLFKVLCDETRLRILYFLIHQEELNVRTLCGMLGQSQPAVSHHLAKLRVAGLIESRRDGKNNFYHIVPNRFQELLGMVFDMSPKIDAGSNGIRIEDFVLSYTPIVDGQLKTAVNI